MARKIVISAIAAYCVGFMLGPPDFISQIILGLMAATLCALPLLILARFRFVKSASKPMQTLTCVLVCMVALLSLACHLLGVRVAGQAQQLQELTSASASLAAQGGQVALLEQGN